MTNDHNDNETIAHKHVIEIHEDSMQTHQSIDVMVRVMYNYHIPIYIQRATIANNA